SASALSVAAYSLAKASKQGRLTFQNFIAAICCFPSSGVEEAPRTDESSPGESSPRQARCLVCLAQGSGPRAWRTVVLRGVLLLILPSSHEDEPPSSEVNASVVEHALCVANASVRLEGSL
ncbi:unnamed protein product, partial [Polarella glacialis]